MTLRRPPSAGRSRRATARRPPARRRSSRRAAGARASRRASSSVPGSSAFSTAQSVGCWFAKIRALAARVFVDVRVAIEVVGREVEQHGDPRPERLRRSRAESCSPRSRGSCRPSRRRPARSAPGRCCRRPARVKPPASSIRPVSVVVVDFPFVPVMATMRPRSQRDASSSSPMTGTPARRAASTAGRSDGTPGLSTTRSAPVNVDAWCPPSSSATPAVRRRSSSVDLLADVGQRHAGAAAHQQLRRGHTASGRADDDDPLAANGERRVAHLSFSVVRLKSAKMIARIRNLVITFGSLQPMSSKWW